MRRAARSLWAWGVLMYGRGQRPHINCRYRGDAAEPRKVHSACCALNMASIPHAFSKALAAGPATAAKRGVALSPICRSLRNGSSSAMTLSAHTPSPRSASSLHASSTSLCSPSPRMPHAAFPLRHCCSSSSNQLLQGSQRCRMATVSSAAAPAAAELGTEEEVDERIPVTVRMLIGVLGPVQSLSRAEEGDGAHERLIRVLGPVQSPSGAEEDVDVHIPTVSSL